MANNSATWIIYAGYGMQTGYFDLTSSIQQQYVGGTTQFSTSGLISTFGDPNPNVLKTLFILYATGAGGTAPGNSVLNSQMTSDPATNYTNPSTNQITIPGGAGIVYAAYGMNSSFLNITGQVQSSYAQGTTLFTASNSAWGSDPDPGVLKTLVIVYTIGPLSGSNAPTLFGLMAQESATNYTNTVPAIQLPT